MTNKLDNLSFRESRMESHFDNRTDNDDESYADYGTEISSKSVNVLINGLDADSCDRKTSVYTEDLASKSNHSITLISDCDDKKRKQSLFAPSNASEILNIYQDVKTPYSGKWNIV